MLKTHLCSHIYAISGEVNVKARPASEIYLGLFYGAHRWSSEIAIIAHLGKTHISNNKVLKNCAENLI